MTLTHSVAADRLIHYLDSGHLLRGAWCRGTRGPDGYEYACALVAMVPDVGDGDYSACPASLLPPWMARMTLWFDDAGSNDAHPTKIRRLAACIRRSGALTPEQWTRLDYTFRRVAVAEARTHCPATADNALSAIDAVLALLDRAIHGDVPTADEFKAAWEAAWEAAAAAWEAAWEAAAAAWAAEARAEEAWAAEARAAAAWAAEAAAEAAEAARAAAAWEAAWEAAAWAAEAARAAEARADHMIDAMLAAWEREIEQADAAKPQE